MQATISLDPFLFILSILFVTSLLLVGLASLFSETFSIPHFVYRKRHEGKETLFEAKGRFLSWLALHYKRDPHALQWVHDVT